MNKGNMMQPAAIQAMATETRNSSRLYSKNNDSGEVVQALVKQLAAELAQMPKKIDLRDEDMIVRVAVAYVDSCANAGIIPPKIGFCRACGLSRQAVDYFLNHHGDEPSAERLRMIFDSFADMLNAAALAERAGRSRQFLSARPFTDTETPFPLKPSSSVTLSESAGGQASF